jgi:hypothetical protein
LDAAHVLLYIAFLDLVIDNNVGGNPPFIGPQLPLPLMLRNWKKWRCHSGAVSHRDTLQIDDNADRCYEILSLIDAFIDVRLYVGLGMCVMDPYLLFKCEWDHFREDGGVIDSLDYAGKLAHSIYSLINKQYLPRRNYRPETTTWHTTTTTISSIVVYMLIYSSQSFTPSTYVFL